MKTLPNYIPQHPGQEQAGRATRFQYNYVSEGPDAYWAGNNFAALTETIQAGEVADGMPGLSGSSSSVSGPWTGSYDAGGTGAYASDGYTLTTAGSSGNKFVLQHARRYNTALTSKAVLYKGIFQIPTITTVSGVLGWINTSTDPFGTPPTNGVYFTLTNGAVVGNVRGASGTLASTGTLFTLSAGVVAELSIAFFNTGVAATSWGYFAVGNTMTPFTAAQITQLIAMTGNLFHTNAVQTNTASARTMILDQVQAEYDR